MSQVLYIIRILSSNDPGVYHYPHFINEDFGVGCAKGLARESDISENLDLTASFVSPVHLFFFCK